MHEKLAPFISFSLGKGLCHALNRVEGYIWSISLNEKVAGRC